MTILLKFSNTGHWYAPANLFTFWGMLVKPYRINFLAVSRHEFDASTCTFQMKTNKLNFDQPATFNWKDAAHYEFDMKTVASNLNLPFQILTLAVLYTV